MKIRIWMAVLCSWFAVVVTSAQESNPPAPSSGEQGQPVNQPAKDHQHQSIVDRGSEESPLVVKLLGAPADQEHPAEHAAKAKDQATADRWTDKWMVYLTGGLIAVGLGQIGLFWWQLGLIRKSLVDTRLSAKAAFRSAQAAKSSSESNIKMAGTMEATAKRQLRAYVLMVHGKEHRDHDDLRFWITIKNCGPTPAYDLVATFDWRAFPGHDTEWPNSDEFRVKSVGGGSRGPLGPGIEVDMPILLRTLADFEMFRIAFMDSNEGRRTLYFFGTVIYRDIYDTTHTTKYCFRHRRGAAPNFTTVCDYHNEAD